MAERGQSENLQCKKDQTFSVDANPLNLFDQSTGYDHQVSFEKHPSVGFKIAVVTREFQISSRQSSQVRCKVAHLPCKPEWGTDMTQATEHRLSPEFDIDY